MQITNNVIEAAPPPSMSPILKRWNRKYTELSQIYYYWTVTVWETKSPSIVKALNDGILQEDKESYKVIKPLIWHKKLIPLDKSLQFSDKDNKSIIDECVIVMKPLLDYSIIHSVFKS
jgi:protoporphyrinogen oxidase